MYMRLHSVHQYRSEPTVALFYRRDAIKTKEAPLVACVSFGKRNDVALAAGEGRERMISVA
jgi:hypothetical protein